MFEINIIKNNIKNVVERVNFLKEKFNYNVKKKRLKILNIELKNQYIWKQPKKACLLEKERSKLENIIYTLDKVVQDLKDAKIFLELANESKDQEILNTTKLELDKLQLKLSQLEYLSLFNNKHDYANCYLDIQAGSGGIEAQDWASMLMRMYLRWLELREFKTEIIDLSEGEIAGIKSVTIKIYGNYAYGWLRTETGVHRLVRKSPFDSGGRRHTSFSSAFVYPEINHDININIKLSDLRIDLYRASGAGGQHVNRTESAVRITHIPTGIVTQCQNDRSQHKNKDQAIKQMKAKLYELEIQKQNANKKAIEDHKSNIGWGSQIRSYILDHSRIKDLRTGIETRNIQEVLNGNLDQFVEASLKAGL